MNANLKLAVAAALLCLGQGVAQADPVGPITTFNSGSTARASEMNANFYAIVTATNRHDSRIRDLEMGVVAGNLSLLPSTPTAGNILKGGKRFIHDFGVNNTFVGSESGNFTMSGSSNTAVGFQALRDDTTGGGNTAVGDRALQVNTTGSFNTGIGEAALFKNTVGVFNTAVGGNAMTENTAGNSNTAVGTAALANNTTGINNTASGTFALHSNTTGSNNTVVGSDALENNTGSNNIAIGSFAGQNLTTGAGNIDIGNTGVAAEAQTIRIGDGQTRAFLAGIRGVGTGNADAVTVVVDSNGQLGTINSSRRVKDDIADMGEASRALMKLRPVTFHYKGDGNPKGRTLQYGLVAEEVAKISPGLVARTADGRIETVYYQFLAPMLVNEYQRQQRTIEAQAAELAELKERLESLAAAVLQSR